MSIIVGIQCSDSILLAADSRITHLTTGTTSNVEKLKSINFKYDRVLIASAGSVPFTNRVIETAQQMAMGKTATKTDVATIMEEAARVSKNHLDQDQLESVRQNGAEMLIAFYCERTPHLLFLDPFGSGIADKPEKHYCAAGVGSHLAEYLIGEHLGGITHSDLATAILIFAVKKIKDNSNLCGGQTHIERVTHASHFRRDGTGIVVEQDKRVSVHQLVWTDLINLAEKKLSKWDEKTKAPRNRKLHSVLELVGNELYLKQKRRAEKSLEIARQLEEEEGEEDIP